MTCYFVSQPSVNKSITCGTGKTGKVLLFVPFLLVLGGRQKTSKNSPADRSTLKRSYKTSSCSWDDSTADVRLWTLELTLMDGYGFSLCHVQSANITVIKNVFLVLCHRLSTSICIPLLLCPVDLSLDRIF